MIATTNSMTAIANTIIGMSDHKPADFIRSHSTFRDFPELGADIVKKVDDIRRCVYQIYYFIV